MSTADKIKATSPGKDPAKGLTRGLKPFLLILKQKALHIPKRAQAIISSMAFLLPPVVAVVFVMFLPSPDQLPPRMAISVFIGMAAILKIGFDIGNASYDALSNFWRVERYIPEPETKIGLRFYNPADIDNPFLVVRRYCIEGFPRDRLLQAKLLKAIKDMLRLIHAAPSFWGLDAELADLWDLSNSFDDYAFNLILGDAKPIKVGSTHYSSITESGFEEWNSQFWEKHKEYPGEYPDCFVEIQFRLYSASSEQKAIEPCTFSDLAKKVSEQEKERRDIARSLSSLLSEISRLLESTNLEADGLAQSMAIASNRFWARSLAPPLKAS